ncbi:MAG: YoaK family protein [Verrucomicrobia bacterium]|nr:YoaK family protein [Verrucomicrobiota bacterium]
MLRHITPAWVYFGGMALATTAGIINAVGFLGQHHQALSHLSGTVTTLGIGFGLTHYDVALHALAILVSFFLGCVVSGAIIRQSSLRLGRRYGVALSLESAALFVSVYFLRRGSNMGDYLAALACGLQNAMVTTYSGSTLRTTHMTGMVTDLGIACGHLLRGTPVDWFRFRIYGVLLLGFFAGGLVGTLGYQYFGYDTLLAPAALSGIAGVGYTVIKHLERRRRHAGTPAA